jgi:predicted Zn-dependent protease
MRPRHRQWIAPLTLLIFFLGSTMGFVALAQQNPYDKFREREYSNRGYLSEDEEMKLAEDVHRQILKEVRLVQGQPVNTYIETLGQKLARRSERPAIRWQFYVVDDASINAFATLGGRVYVHTGLIAATTTEAQLVSVIGHEIGHIVGRHGLENVKKAQKYGTLGAIASIAGAILGGKAGAVVDLAGNLVAGGYLMKHSRDAEREADFLGLYNMDRASYNARGMVEMFEILSRISQSQPNQIGSILASHPPAAERAQNTSREISEHLPGSTSTQRLMTTSEYNRIREGLPRARKVRPRN